MLQKIEATRDFLEECWEEVQKVTFPDFEQTRSVTIVVIIFSIAVSLVIWIMDITVRQILEFIMGIFGA
jgi:preprotein translocase subunit SecE